MNRLAADLLPIMHPLYNLREICKQCALLEDHLNNERKRCQDCIRKHFLTIEALFEEATSLDNKAKWADKIDGKAELTRELQTRWIDGDDPREIAQDIRALRKDFAPECFDLREMTEESRMASTRGASLASLVAERLIGRERHVCGSSNPVRDLRELLERFHAQAMEGDQELHTPQNQQALANLMQRADEALTGKVMLGRSPYNDYARRVLGFDGVVMQLADGGYSRLIVTVVEEPFVRLDERSSLPVAVQNWKLLRV